MQHDNDRLTQEADLTRARLQEEVRALGEDVVEGLELREHVRAHPWISMGLGAAAGFALSGLRPRSGSSDCKDSSTGGSRGGHLSRLATSIIASSVVGSMSGE